MEMTTQLVGLTGGIACGKSTVAALFEQTGAKIVDADVLAREVVAPGSDGLEAIVAAFGTSVLLEDGSLNREAMGALVFGDDQNRKRLNQITHPRIAQATMSAISQYRAAGETRVVYDAALIVENGMADAFRPLVVVSADANVQLARLMARNGLSEEEAQERISSQLPLSEKEAAADFVIDNSGSLEALGVRFQEVLRALEGWQKK